MTIPHTWNNLAGTSSVQLAHLLTALSGEACSVAPIPAKHPAVRVIDNDDPPEVEARNDYVTGRPPGISEKAWITYVSRKTGNVAKVIREAGAPISTHEIARRAGICRSYASSILKVMLALGEVKCSGHHRCNAFLWESA